NLEKILARAPQHPGANHYYIHAVEASPHPERALACADRLRDLMPGAGHMVHMPAHIYQRLGRYEDANTANRKAVESDKTYAAVARDSLTAIRDATPEDAVEDLNSAKALLTIALNLLSGEIAWKRGDKDGAVRLLEEAVKGEDATRYSEAADWIYPTRHHLG